MSDALASLSRCSRAVFYVGALSCNKLTCQALDGNVVLSLEKADYSNAATSLAWCGCILRICLHPFHIRNKTRLAKTCSTVLFRLDAYLWMQHGPHGQGHFVSVILVRGRGIVTTLFHRRHIRNGLIVRAPTPIVIVTMGMMRAPTQINEHGKTQVAHEEKNAACF